MQPQTIRMLIPLLMIAVTTPAFSADKETVRRELQAIYERGDRAWREKDLRAIMAPVAADFTGKQLDGKTVDRAQSEATNKAILELVKSFRETSATVGEVVIRGDEAIITVNGKATGVLLDPQGKEKSFTQLGVWRDTWRKTAGGWKIRREEDVRIEQTIDGKKADPYDPFGQQKGDEAKPVRRQVLPLAAAARPGTSGR
jgi:ketosteroid isomerase-like protein